MDRPPVAAASPYGANISGLKGLQNLQGPSMGPVGGLDPDMQKGDLYAPRPGKVTVCGEPLWGDPSGALAPEEPSPAPTTKQVPQERDLACPLNQKETQFLLTLGDCLLIGQGAGTGTW